VLNQTQVPHLPRRWSSLASGLGWCDQINGAAARVAAHAFKRAQLYALYDAAHKTSPHTIGRVWSDGRNDWLYFDAFYETPVVFARKQNGAPEFVAMGHTAMRSRGPAPEGVYRLRGWVMNEYRPSFGGQIEARLVNRLGLGGIEPPPPIIPVEPPTIVVVYDGSVFQRVAQAYARARMTDVLDDSPNRDAYRAIANDASAARDTRASELAAASRVFAMSR
jgi:hypothetical protein